MNVFPSFYCECFPHMKGKNHYNIPIALIFRQCLYSESDIASYILGWMSILMSMISLFPQMIKNHVFQSASGLSLHLFIIWMIGDVTNLLGCIFTHQLSTQIYLAIYYVCMDILILSQYCYYQVRMKDLWETFSKCLIHLKRITRRIFRRMFTKILKPTQSNTCDSNHSSTRVYTSLNSHVSIQLFTIMLLLFLFCNFPSSSLKLLVSPLRIMRGEDEAFHSWNMNLVNEFQESPSTVRTTVRTLRQNCSHNTAPTTDQDSISYALGIACSYISCACYILAYLPQMYKNFKEKSVKGLSVSSLLLSLLIFLLKIEYCVARICICEQFVDLFRPF